jgi:uncharacterized protein YjbI with pentapeptide repeats
MLTNNSSNQTTNQPANQQQTQVNTPHKEESKKIDFINFIIGSVTIPVLVAILGIVFGLFQFDIQDKQSKKAILKEYVDSISSLRFDRDLDGNKEEIEKNIQDIKNKFSESKKIPSPEEKLLEFAAIKKEEDKIDTVRNARFTARAQTLTALRRLDNDGESKAEIVRFLHEAKLVQLSNSSSSQDDLNSSICSSPQTLVNLCGSNLKNVQLQEAWLWRVNLKGAILWDANFSKANLKEADLKGTDMKSAKLINADLRSTDLTNANLDSADLTGACYNRETKIDDSKKQVMKEVPPEKDKADNFICENFNDKG